MSSLVYKHVFRSSNKLFIKCSDFYKCNQINGNLNFSSISLLSRTPVEDGGISRTTTSKPSFIIYFRKCHTDIQSKLMEFFDAKENWEKTEIKVGRAWLLDELRIKSNEDLHKLWYVFLKEKNMLLTMEHEYKENFEVFPNPERIDKVEESMKNIETVVRERNKAYWLLEIGETGEIPSGNIVDPFGRTIFRKFSEHVVPYHINKRALAMRPFLVPETFNFLKLYRERKMRQQRRYQRHLVNEVAGILSRYPKADLQALQEKFPSVDVQKVRHSKIARGHHEFNVD